MRDYWPFWAGMLVIFVIAVWGWTGHSYSTPGGADEADEYARPLR